MASTLYIVLSLLLACANLILSFVVFMKPSHDARYLGAALLCTVVINLSYLGVLVSAADYGVMSLCSSVYFCGIDLALFFLFMYVVSFTDQGKKAWARVLFYVFLACLLVDGALLLSNPVTEMVLSYAYNADAFVAWRFEPHALFIAHLCFCYFMVATVLFSFAVKMLAVPRMYIGRYQWNAIAFLAIILLNAVFLYMPDNSLPDFSVLMYSVMAFLLYWTGFRYGDKSTLAQTNAMIVDGLGHPVVMFDYEDKLAFVNSAADAILPKENRRHDYTIQEFIEDCGFNHRGLDFESDISFHSQFKEDGLIVSYRCDYRVLEDDRNRCLARIFMFARNAMERDLLTGFFTRATFEENEDALVQDMLFPLCIAVCDVNRLSRINESYGREQGDAAIQALANLLRKHFPKSAYFVRLSEANLMVICPSATIAYMKEQLSLVSKDFGCIDYGKGPLSMQSAVAYVASRDVSISTSVDLAFSSMKARKLLDGSSSHSSLLDSFAQTQRESDGETEEHVQRTQLLGDKLGERLGLNDGEQSSLALLCLLHDIGKVGIPLEILNKPGKLTEEEWEVMKSHVEKGYRIANASTELRGIANLILHHHEAWDGSGYPDGLTHDAIPLLARILAVVDTYDAMTNDRPYRPAMTNEEACAELKRCAGTQFDPYIVAEFLLLIKEEGVVSQVKHLRDNAEASAAEGEGTRPMGSSVLNAEAKAGNVGFAQNAGGIILRPVLYSKYILDESKRIIEIDEEFTNLTGYTREDLETYQLTQLDLIFPEELEQYKDISAAFTNDHGEAYIEHRIRRKDGMPRHVFCFGVDNYDAIHRAIRTTIVVADLMYADTLKMLIRRERISARRNIALLEDSSRRDPLTGLSNRNHFRSEVQASLLKNDARIMMFISDLDEFKEYNDTYGHPQGDELLKMMASGLEQAVYPAGIACRMGGDEFAAAVLVEKTATVEDMKQMTQNVFERVSSVLDDYSPGVTISMGVSVSEEGQARSFTHLYHQADNALYKVKREGRNSYECSF